MAVCEVVDVMRAADPFYKTQAWRDCREAYISYAGGLCEECLKHGRYEPGVIVHHKIHLSPENYNDPDISLAFENLELLCRGCHAEKHQKKIKRFNVDGLGRISPR